MNVGLMTAYYQKRGLSLADLGFALRLLEDAEKDCPNQNLATIDELDLDRLIRELYGNNRASLPALVAMMRYFHLIGRADLYIHLTKYTGAHEVVETILDRMTSLPDAPSRETVLEDLSIPPLGTPPAEYPAFTDRFIRNLKKHCPSSLWEPVLAGNNHQIPAMAFAEENRAYEAAPDLETYLRELHDRQVAILQQHCDEKKVWFEQEITQAVVDLVRDNPEIQSAVLRDGKLFLTKIPYDGKRMLAETDPIKRRYYACHCPFVREAILRSEPKIDPDWCLCSAGFVKFQFECLFGRPLQAKILKSALLGDEACRFEIDLSEIPYKKKKSD